MDALLQALPLIPPGSVIDGKALWETALASAVAGVGVTAIASTAIFAFATFAEARRDERFGVAALAGLLAVLAAIAFAAAIAFGLYVMIDG